MKAVFFIGIRKGTDLTCEGITAQKVDLKISNFSLGKEGAL